MAESPLERLVGAWEFEPFVEGSRGAFAVAERLGTEPVIFPSNHGGSAANTDRPGIRMPSRPSCGTS
jgi:hypothetical protein